MSDIDEMSNNEDFDEGTEASEDDTVDMDGVDQDDMGDVDMEDDEGESCFCLLFIFRFSNPSYFP